MNKKLLLGILIVAVLALVLGGYYYWKTKTQKSATQQAVEDIQKTAADISAGIGNNVTPDVTTPNANPYSQTNPFSNLKTNPFQ